MRRAGRKPPQFDQEPAAPTARELVADGVLTVKDAAAFAGVSPTTIKELIRGGVLPSLLPGKCRVVPRRALVEWLAAQVETRSEGA